MPSNDTNSDQSRHADIATKNQRQFATHTLETHAMRLKLFSGDLVLEEAAKPDFSNHPIGPELNLNPGHT